MKKHFVTAILALCLCGASAAQQPSVWVTMGEDVFGQLARVPGGLAQKPAAAATGDGVVVTRLAVRDLQAVSAFVHSTTNRCSGFIVHRSFDEAAAAMESAARGSYGGLKSTFAIDQQTLVNQLLPLADDANILATIDHLSTAYNNRYYQNASGQQSALWIRDQWQSFAAGRSDVTVETYSHAGYVQPSVILTIDGATLPGEVIVLGAHLDSIQSGANNTNPATLAPGADDDASGIATLSETLRVLLANGYVPDRTVKFMGYAAEEVGLQGSGDIAADFAAASTNVVAVMQLDMTGYNGSAEDIVLIDDFTNAQLTAFVADLVEEYQPSVQWTTTSCGYACSDHASWTNQGYPAAFPFEARFGQHNPQIHTTGDTVATLGASAAHALKFAKLALSFTVEVGTADSPPSPGGPQTAAYDAVRGVPVCALAGSSCDSTSLLDGRAGLGPEPNAPNALGSCADGTSGGYHSDESNDRIVVSTLDGADMAEGATVQVDATVWAWSTGSEDTLDLYYAADADNPAWTFLASLNPPAGGAQTLSAQYTLPAGALQAVRAQFRYQGSASPCTSGSYNDRDDLVFTVGGAGPGCTLDADCDDGLYCNGAETCNAGTCQAGTAPTCDDGVACTVDACNEGTDSCDATPNNGLCDNGLFCDGAETCSATLGCLAGSAPNCDDGVGCTVDACNEGTDSCDNTPDDGACSNGLFCDGVEVCHATLDCQDGPDPCSGGQTCNETTDVCEGGGGCLHDVDFESGAGGWTAGANTCTTGAFVLGTPDATTWQVGGGNPGQAYYTAPNPGGIGSNDVDGGTCEALSPVVGAGGEAAVQVSLDYFHGQRDAGDDAGDGFTVEVLNNGSVAATLVSIGDVTTNPAWTSASATIVNPGNLQVRVRAADATGGGDIIEGGIDNVSICPTTPPSCVVDDDFEGGTAGWVNDPASTCSTGAYVEGNPTNPGGGQQIVGSHSGVTSLFTGVNTSAGNADVDGGNCILGSPSWSVGSASTLSVWYWHGQRDAGDDAAGDFFRLEYSLNGGSTWNTMASVGDVASTAAWTNATAQVAAGSNVRLRVQCSDGTGGGDLVECGIDDVSICGN